MSSGNYLPKDDMGLKDWLIKFSIALPGYAEVLALSDDTVKRVVRHAKNFEAVMNGVDRYRTYGLALTAYKNLMRDGTEEPGTLVERPEAIVFDGQPEADIFGEVRALVNSIKKSKKYNEAMGKALGVEGSSPAEGGGSGEIKPELNIELQGGKPNILWKKGKMDGVKIMVDRGTGSYSFLAVDLYPDYLDTHPLPELGKSELWKYIAIYLKRDEEVGNWSDPVQISVTGRPA